MELFTDRPNLFRMMAQNAVFAVCAIAFVLLFSGQVSAETRKLKLHFIHTGEKSEITFKKNGRYSKSGLDKINRFLRDWRRNEPTKMDPKLLDLIWEVYKETGSRNYITVISGYRSPATNKLLRKRGRGVAKKSQHTLGKALDFFIPGVSLRTLRNIGLKKGLGGVGYYPKSGSPFVHMDTGSVRHWPRMSRKELVQVFPRGKTLHVPTDGKPLPNYNLAKAEYERKLKGTFSVASAEEINKKPSIFAKWFDRSEGSDEEVDAKPTKRPAVASLGAGDRSDRTPRNASVKGAGQITPKAEKQVLPQSDAKPESDKPESDKVEAPALPQTTANQVPSAPVPSVGIPASSEPVDARTNPTAPEPEQAPEQVEEISPELVIAGLSGDAVPVPVLSPLAAQRSLPTAPETAPATAEEAVAVQIAEAQADENLTENEALQLAYAVPVRAERQGEANPIEQLAGNDTGSQQSPAGPSIQALSADEIADLRQSVYAQLDSQQAQDEAATSVSQLGLLPSPSQAPNKAQTAIWNQIASHDAREVVDQDENVSSIVQSIEIASIPLPSPAPRTSVVSRARQPAVAGVSARAEAKSAATPTSEEVVEIDEYRLGNWALQPSVSLEEIKNIKSLGAVRQPASNRAQSILSRGFVVDAAAGQSGFGNKVLGPLDFNRLQ